jgi:hypothetical protein
MSPFTSLILKAEGLLQYNNFPENQSFIVCNSVTAYFYVPRFTRRINHTQWSHFIVVYIKKYHFVSYYSFLHLMHCISFFSCFYLAYIALKYQSWSLHWNRSQETLFSFFTRHCNSQVLNIILQLILFFHVFSFSSFN